MNLSKSFKNIEFYLCPDIFDLDKIKGLAKFQDSNMAWLKCPSVGPDEPLISALEVLAQKALDLWPSWYDLFGQNTLSLTDWPQQPNSREGAIRLFKIHPKILPSWFAGIRPLLAERKPPILAAGLSKLGQIWQLALAIGASLDILAFHLSAEVRIYDLIGWLKTLAGFERLLNRRVAVFIPKALHREVQLAPLTKLAVLLPETRKNGTYNPDLLEKTEPETSFTPTLALELLAQTLNEDKRLHNLLRTDVLAANVGNTAIRANFLGPEQLAVIIDRFQETPDRTTFYQARRIDALLTAEGYRVLRLSDKEIENDLIGSAEKIAELVLSQSKPSWTYPKFKTRGLPNTQNPGQVILSRLLSERPELDELFFINKTLTLSKQKILADFVWPKGFLIVQTDGGLPFHQDLAKFIDGRNKDYLLLSAGFTVLKLTAEELRVLPEECLDKIAHLAFVNQPQL
jgi:very-short-patch-repair endonuclease